MFTVITRTANRPRYFAECRRSVTEQTEQAFHIVISDDPADTYMDGNLVLRVPHLPGRGHNLYFNEARQHIPPAHPWVIFLDDDDAFATSDALRILREKIRDAYSLALWQVEFPGGRLIPGGSVFLPPMAGNISGIGFCYHSQHWEDWKPDSFGDFFVINSLYSHLRPVWINQVLTKVQAVGNGLRMDADV